MSAESTRLLGKGILGTGSQTKLSVGALISLLLPRLFLLHELNLHKYPVVPDYFLIAIIMKKRKKKGPISRFL
jgi:hypothetical protein